MLIEFGHKGTKISSISSVYGAGILLKFKFLVLFVLYQ